MNYLELATLIRYCKKYDIDFQEIDDSLNFRENKEHLRELMQMIARTLDVFEIERMAEMQNQYMKEHFISYYLACQMAGETKSTKIGQPSSDHKFSLKLFTEQQS